MTGNKPSKNLWALSSLASTIGAGDFAVEDHDSFRRQEFVFAALNLLLIGALLALQAISKIVRGRPSESVIVVLAAGFTIQAVYFIWLRARVATISQGARRFLTYWSLGFNSMLALVLTSLTIRGDTAYYASDASSHTRSVLQTQPWRHDRGDRTGGLHQLHGRVRPESSANTSKQARWP